MKFSEKYLTPHGLFADQTFDEFCSKIPKFYFRSEVPLDVIQNFEIVEKLLAHSYYEYKFIDEAFSKAIHTFEMAMSIRYKDFHSVDKKLTFHFLIEKLSDLNLFDTSLESLKLIKRTRNNFAHPVRHSFAGVVFWGKIEMLVRLINEMYEDINLRLERRILISEFIINMKTLNLEKGIVIDIEGQKSILFNLRFIFINNKRNPITCLLAFTPLFDLEDDGLSIKVPRVFKSKLINPTFTNEILTGLSFSAKKKIIFSSIKSHPELLQEYENWNSRFSLKKNKFQYESSTELYLNEFYEEEALEFQKM